MSQQFTLAYKDENKVIEWLTWIGQPMVYDGGLCVNRSLEEHANSANMQVVLVV
jgi:hypothetical protein